MYLKQTQIQFSEYKKTVKKADKLFISANIFSISGLLCCSDEV